MGLIPLIGLLAASPVAVHLQDVGGVDEEVVSALTTEISRSIEAHTGTAPVLDKEKLTGCTPLIRCINEVTNRTSAEHVVLLRIYGASTKLRLIIDRFDPRANRTNNAHRDLEVDPRSWRPSIDTMMIELFPEPIVEIQDPLPKQLPESRVRTSADGGGGWSDVVPWVIIGGSAVALGVGIGFGVSSRNASAAIADMPPGQDVSELSRRANDHATIANVLFVSSAVGVAVGLIWLALD